MMVHNFRSSWFTKVLHQSVVYKRNYLLFWEWLFFDVNRVKNIPNKVTLFKSMEKLSLSNSNTGAVRNHILYVRFTAFSLLGR